MALSSIGKAEWPMRTAGIASSSHFLVSSCTPHAQISANALSGAHKDTPQRSAGSFNMVHPMRKASMSSAQHDRSASDVEVDNGENDVLLWWGMPCIDTTVGTSLSSPCFFDAYSWANQPFLPTIPTSDCNVCSQNSNMLECIMISRGSGVSFIFADDSMSMASSSSAMPSLTPQAPPKPGLQHQVDHKSGSMFDDTLLLRDPPPPPENLTHQCSSNISSCSPASKLFHEGINTEGKSTTLSNKILVQGKKNSVSATKPSFAEVSCNRAIKLHPTQKRRRHGVAITDPQSIAARGRKEKLRKKIRTLQSLVPNGERLDTVSMLGQTLEYIRFLQYQLGELYHGPDSMISPLTSSKCEKWEAFMGTHSTATTSTTSSTVTSSQ